MILALLDKPLSDARIQAAGAFQQLLWILIEDLNRYLAGDAEARGLTIQ